MRPIALRFLVALSLVAAACTSQADSGDPANTDDAVTPTLGGSTDSDGDADDAAGSDEGTASTEAAERSLDDVPVERVALPLVPVVTLPDLSQLDEVGTQIEGELGDFATDLDVISASCAADGGELVYQGTDGTSFFDLDPDGSGSVVQTDGSTVTINIDADGSGDYVRSGADGVLTISVNADGSGNYVDTRGTASTAIDVAPDGTGSYNATAADDSTLTVDIESDEAGRWVRTGSDGSVSVDVEGGGAGRYATSGNGQSITIEQDADGSWRYTTTSTETSDVITLEVEADGSGSYSRAGADSVVISVEPDGSGVYQGGDGPPIEFTTSIGLLDPELIVAGPLPVFAVAGRLPPLDTLAPLSPPCVTILRLGADVLFDFDDDQLRPEADPVLDEVAAVLISEELAVDVHGHTDAIGTGAYNQDLSERRAQAVADALTERGVTSINDVVGFGEQRPVAPNEASDGSDNPAGRQLNRRVELIIQP